MSRVFNFSAGPAVLPKAVLQQAHDELLDWQGSGVSVMEMSHRGKEFMSIAAQAEKDLREIMAIPDNYKVLFLQGGASSQFTMVPMNLLGDKTTADYAYTGHWSKKAVAEGKRHCDANVVVDTSADKFTTLPPQSGWKLNKDAAYLHYTPNETIAGVEFNWTPEAGDVPLVADMSSSILSRAIDVSKYGVIYAGAQKNIGPAGLTIVIIREDLLDLAGDNVPPMLHYKIHADNDSMYNTPPTFAWYMAGLVFQWIKKQGGVKAMAEINKRKAGKLYDAIDASGGFYRNPVQKDARSLMNVPFILVDEALDKDFLDGAAKTGLVQLKGHRSVGGMRASIYNAMPEEGIDVLVDYMKQFQSEKG
ncbi:MAG: 3-phosphoserine/phosphohydroxythreonine transaminase [Gammaproteobacteria bacterium]|nr:3-phosphoserine/phosphohydroxythreonine transaminase [Gammaproteobacteria bacterium]